MRMKLKYVLPLAQMALAVWLLWWTIASERAAMRHSDMPGTPLVFAFLVSINAPLALPRVFVFMHLPGWWEYITFIAAIGLLWYWVALNIHSWKRERSLFTFSWSPLRLTVDIVAISLGGILAYINWNEIHHYMPIFSNWSWLVPSTRLSLAWSGFWFIPSTVLYLGWSVVLIYFFGRDFLHCFLGKKPLARDLPQS